MRDIDGQDSLLRRASAAGAAAMAIALAACPAVLAMASHEGWPRIGRHRTHAHNQSGVLRGVEGVHSELLGGHGNDTIWAGNDGDVIWGDSKDSGQPTSQFDRLHGGAGEDWIYASHGHNLIWTGAGRDHVALVYGYGTVYCDGPGRKTLVMRYLPQNRHWRLVGCNHKVIQRYRA